MKKGLSQQPLYIGILGPQNGIKSAFHRFLSGRHKKYASHNRRHKIFIFNILDSAPYAAPRLKQTYPKNVNSVSSCIFQRHMLQWASLKHMPLAECKLPAFNLPMPPCRGEPCGSNLDRTIHLDRCSRFHYRTSEGNRDRRLQQN